VLLRPEVDVGGAEPALEEDPAAVLHRLRAEQPGGRDGSVQRGGLVEVSLLGRAGQGRIGDGRRLRPSAHALYPLALTAVAGDVDGLAAGAYRYEAEHDVPPLLAEGDHRGRGPTSVARAGARLR